MLKKVALIALIALGISISASEPVAARGGGGFHGGGGGFHGGGWGGRGFGGRG